MRVRFCAIDWHSKVVYGKEKEGIWWLCFVARHGEVQHGIKRRMCGDSVGRVGNMCKPQCYKNNLRSSCTQEILDSFAVRLSKEHIFFTLSRVI